MDDDQIEAALDHSCDVCGIGPGHECCHVVTGEPLLESTGYPIHTRRIHD